MAFFVKLPSLSSFSPRPQRRAASPVERDESFYLVLAERNIILPEGESSAGPTLPQQLVSLAHAMLDEALAVVQRLDAVGLDGVDLGQEVRQPLRQQSSRCRLQLCKVLP